MVLAILSFVVVLSLVVLVHEFGHFLAARKAGVPVYEFSIGFPFSPKIATLFRHRETEFTLRLLPLGGFVGFSDDNSDPEAEKFLAAPPPVRALILFGGSLFNMIFSFLIFIPAYMVREGIPLFTAVAASLQTVGSITGETFMVISRLLTGGAGIESLSGPLGIAVLAGQAAGGGPMDLVFFTGLLSLSIGIMNLLPFPGLDGGQLLMLFVEVIRKRPLGARAHQIINLAGIMLFVVLSLFVTWHDITTLMG